jgi:hypothetical protein
MYEVKLKKKKGKKFPLIPLIFADFKILVSDDV